VSACSHLTKTDSVSDNFEILHRIAQDWQDKRQGFGGAKAIMIPLFINGTGPEILVYYGTLIYAAFWSTPFAIPYWLAPYAFGIMRWNYQEGRQGQGLGWLFFLIAIPVLFVVGQNMTYGPGVENSLDSTRGRILVVLSGLVGLIQLFFWGVAWIRRKPIHEMQPWEEIAGSALFLTIVLMLPLFISAPNLIHQQSYTTEVHQKDTQATLQLSKFGFEHYPNCPIVDLGFRSQMYGTDPREDFFQFDFTCSDPPGEILGFYEQHATDAGCTVRRGQRRESGQSCLLAVGTENNAIIIEKKGDIGWLVSVYRNTGSDFEASIKQTYAFD